MADFSIITLGSDAARREQLVEHREDVLGSRHPAHGEVAPPVGDLGIAVPDGSLDRVVEALAVRRLCYDGKETWMRQYNATYAAGDLWGCIGRWYSGRWHDTAADGYISRVRATLNARTWLSASF